MDVTQRIDELRAQVHYHAHRYHVLDDPIISDDAYDALYRELEELEATHPELIKNAETLEHQLDAVVREVAEETRLTR